MCDQSVQQASEDLRFVRATVADRTAALVYGNFDGADRFGAILSLEGLPRGPLTLDVLAEDVGGGQARFVQPFVYDLRPVLTMSAPLDYTVATPTVRVTASCTDDDPSGCELEVLGANNAVLLSGRNAIDADLDLSDIVKNDAKIIRMTFLDKEAPKKVRSFSD